MNEARSSVFSSIRFALGAKGQDKDRIRNIDAISAMALSDVANSKSEFGDDLSELMHQKLEAVSATFVELNNVNEIPAAIVNYLKEKNLALSLIHGDDARIINLPWQEVEIERRIGLIQENDLASLSYAEFGIAETGTIVLFSGQHNPTTSNFLPEHHMIILRKQDIIPDMETLWPFIRAKYGKGKMPRTVNMITGPSRSADIEQKILLGAHGPQYLHVLMVA